MILGNPKKRTTRKRTTRRRNQKKDSRTYGEKLQDNIRESIIKLATNTYVIVFVFGIITGIIMTLYMLKNIIG